MSSKTKARNSRFRKRVRQKVSFVGLPSSKNQPLAISCEDISQPSPARTPVPTRLKDPLLDPAKQVLLRTQEAKKKRQQAELQVALTKIQQRVDYTLNEYEGLKLKTASEEDASRAAASIEVVEDPNQLYELLRDSRQRTKYQQKLTVFILGYEEKCDNRERLLSSLHDFFLENQASGTQRMLDEMENDDFDLEDATSGLESAMDTAQHAAERLLAIKQEMSKLIAIVAAFPDTKKGRKKLEKALMKAQEEVETLSVSLEQVQSELEESKGQAEELLGQVELKAQECARLKTEADKVKFLQVGKEKIANELKAAQSDVETLKLELEETKTLVPTGSEMLVKTTTIATDRNRIQDLEEELAREKAVNQDLMSEKEELENEHRQELEALQDDYEAEMDEVRASYEEQLKSLMEDELFPDGEEPVGNQESDMFALSKEFSMFPEESKLYKEESAEQHRYEKRMIAADTSASSLSQDHKAECGVISTGSSSADHDPDTFNALQPHQPPAATPMDQVSTSQADEKVSGQAHMDTQRNPVHKPDEVPSSQNRETPTTCTVKLAATDVFPLSDQIATPPNEYGATPPDTPKDPLTSESESGVSTPKRTRRESLAMRRQSLAGKRRESLLGGGTHRESVASGVLDKLKQEFESREKKLKQDIDDIKAKSRKTITALRAQLTMSQNKDGKDLETAQNEVGRLQALLTHRKVEAENLEEQKCLLENEKTSLIEELSQGRSELETQQALIKQLEKQLKDTVQRLQRSQVQRHEDQALGNENSVVDKSAQWSDGGFSDQVVYDPSSIHIQHDLVTPIVCEPQDGSFVQCPSVSITESHTSTPMSRSIVIDHANKSSFLQSNSLVSSIPGTAGHTNSTMMHSMGQVTHEHPVVMEWVKVCEGVRVFRDSMIGALCLSGRFRSVVNDLMTLNVHSVDRSQNVHDEVTACRLSVSLLLHQLTLSLTEVLTQVSQDPSSNAGEDELRVTVDTLKRKLREQESNHLKLAESKERIFSLSSTVNCLKAELVSVRKSLALSQTDKDSAIMFTRLDSERNIQTLKSALEKDKISQTTYNKVVSTMKDYLSIAGQRLASVSQQFTQSTHTKQLAKDIQSHYGPSAEGSDVLERLAQQQHKKRLEFSVRMDRLGLKRLDLANTLTHTLQHIEKHARVFLIKPVFSRSAGLQSQSLIYPVTRPLPKKKQCVRSQTSTPHPSMKLVNRLIQSSQQGRTSEVLINSSLERHQHSPHSLRTTHILKLEDEWSVESSLPVNHTTGDFVNPLLPDYDSSPTHPKMVEIDIRKHRHHQALLGHILPCLHQTRTPAVLHQTVHRIPSPSKHAPLPTTQSKEEVPLSKSKVIPSQSSGVIAPITMRVEFDFPSGHAPLPPIATVHTD